MNVLKAALLLVSLVGAAACSDDDASSSAAGGTEVSAGDGASQQQSRAAGGSASAAARGDVVPGGAKVPGGFAERAATMPLPAPVTVGSGAGPISPKALALRPATVQEAVLGSMGEAGRDVKVEVTRGVVYLTGEVDSEADFQRANYVARAVDGVIEVDQSGMRVRR